MSKYVDAEYNLNYAAKDATDVVASLKGSSVYDKVHELQILDRDATRSKIGEAGAFLRKAAVNDTIVVFMAGHGLLDDKLDYYFATTDVNFSRPAGKGLPYDAIEALFDGVKAQRRLVLMDTCHSGEVDADDPVLVAAAAVPGVKARAVATRGIKKKKKKKGQEREASDALPAQATAAILSGLFADLRRGAGATVIASAGGAEYAFESDEWNNGVFTYSLLEGLRTKKADTDANKRVSISETRDYLKRRVSELTKGGQSPTTRTFNHALDFSIF